MSKKSKVLTGGSLFIVAACVLISFGAAAPAYFRLTRDEFSLESFAAPRELSFYLPHRIQGPRYKAIREICARYPPGTIGMDVETYRLLPQLERAHIGDSCYIEFEQIVSETGQPIRFKGAPPDSVRFEIRFLTSDPALGGVYSGEAPIEVFEAMGLFELGVGP